MHSKLLVIATACTLCGCVPIPYFRHHAPELSGEVRRAGQPLGDARIEVTSLLEGERRTTRTDAHGRFAVTAIEQFRFTTQLLGDPLIHYRLEIIDAGVSYLGYERFAMGNHLPAVRLDCELGRAADAQTPACEERP
ncbi:carboxypeptidase-like regulatory domain-containing protein [Pseudomonas sp. LRF_L74]|uniref:carboxypeptidase-like regulatory domain-containing protein n=1 Tax=Pseudomonas sp. LRF_L74 TaxID=3369422 RepID=UPI003F62A683